MTGQPKTDRSQSSAADEFIWDTTGHTEVHSFVQQPIANILKNNNIKYILDIGCGNGSFTGFLASLDYDATGIDHSLSGISIASDKYSNLKFEQHDIHTPLNRMHHSHYDAVVSVEVIEHLLLPRKLLENSYQALKPGGTLILTTPYHGYLKNLALALTNSFDNHWHPLRDYGHIKFFSKKTLCSLVKEMGFTDLKISTVGRIPALARSMIISCKKPK